MSIVTYTVTAVVCNVCGDECEGPVSHRRQVRAARAMARQEGWTVSDGRDLCPDCTLRIEDCLDADKQDEAIPGFPNVQVPRGGVTIYPTNESAARQPSDIDWRNP